MCNDYFSVFNLKERGTGVRPYYRVLGRKGSCVLGVLFAAKINFQFFKGQFCSNVVLAVLDHMPKLENLPLPESKVISNFRKFLMETMVATESSNT